MKHPFATFAMLALFAGFGVQAHAVGSPTPTDTDTASPTVTDTASPTVTDTPTPTISETASPTPTITGTGTPTGAGGAAVDLGCADGFSALGATTITNTGNSSATGYVGLYPGTSETGFGTLSESCTDHLTDSVAQCAQTAVIAAYNDASTRSSTATITSDLGTFNGGTLGPGVYTSGSSIGLTGTLTLNGGGDPGAVFIFIAGSTLTTASSSQVLLTNGAQAKNVFWAIYGGVTLGTGTHFVGTIISDVGAITLNTGATVDGRILTHTGAISLDAVTITTTSSALVPCTASTPTSTPSPTPSNTGTPSTPTPTDTPVAQSAAPGDTYIYPSPTLSDSATAVYYLKEAGQATLKFYNQTGRLVDSIRESKPMGWQASQVNVGKFAAGTYYYVVFAIYDSGATEAQKPRKFVVLH